MKSLITFLCAWLPLFSMAATAPTDTCNHRLWYTAPASIWEETLPLGNGRLGMMPDGGVDREHIVLNEISLWSGSESDYRNPEASKSLPAIRQLLFEGKNLEAQELMYRSFVPKKQETDGRYGSYQVLGDLDIDFSYPASSGPEKYVRSLSLRDGVAHTSFTLGGVDYGRTYFVSRDRDVMLVRLTASRPGALSFSARLSRAAQATVSADGDVLLMSGQLSSGNPGKKGMKYRVAMHLLSKGGAVSISPEKGITLKEGQEAWLILSATTSFAAEGTDFSGDRYVEVCDSLLKAVDEVSGMEQSHMAAHRDLYDRVSLTLPASPDDALPTNERLLRFADRPVPGLAALYYNYGRYLLISSTRPGSLPPNLQGLWANGVLTPWNGDYHTNINIQMNHWPLEQAGLSELYQPLTTLMERLIPSGEETARAFYGEDAEGWVLHMMTNVWNYTAPGEHPSWGATNTGGAWLCAHLWEHYQYSQDKAYLERIYPILKGAARFFASTTVREPRHGWLVTAPTSSPENAFYVPGDTVHSVSICMGPTMDVQLLTELYTNVIAAARILGRDADLVARLEADMKQFPPMQVSKEGYLQEWLEDYREVDVHHRHVSHLYGLHPANLISPLRTPELAEACRVTLNRRGDEATGWSRAWKMNFWARLGDGNRAWKLFRSLLHPAVDPQTGAHGSGTFPNLFCAHPPFQIDGNYGGTAGIGEMLLQSHEGFIHLLPALPDSWDEGSFRHMRVRGGASVDLDWQGGRAVQATVRALCPGTFLVRMPAGATEATVTIGGKATTLSDEMIELKLAKGEAAELRFVY
ncbi:MAG TPA: glycoside hydrolase N-terminal domain-containing protein [Candidatus Bacteroides pullicola]|uniref:Glycoside hydrolase N-terminal domain-containing protein n=1 Tax=Candidatus Bacteroides pullicola TaxID=2838475 RepID=A0A9D2CLI6_9BACE|nr:glycoside hydrolase N-terminal domain-containing protein [Candidatus Bacteroides pullicola]